MGDMTFIDSIEWSDRTLLLLRGGEDDSGEDEGDDSGDVEDEILSSRLTEACWTGDTGDMENLSEEIGDEDRLNCCIFGIVSVGEDNGIFRPLRPL